MRKNFLLLLLLLVTFTGTAFSQNVLVTGALVGNGTYPTLGAAFTAINGGAQTGALILVSIVGNTTESGTATLNQGTWTYVYIAPNGGVARTISGNIAGPLISFNSADRVAIDGLNTGGNSLTIENTNTGNASTLHFVNDARAVGFQNLTLLGASTSTAMGTVFIDAGTGTGGGNDSLGFSAVTITNSGANFPTNAVYSAGNATAGQENSSVQFQNCNISNFFSATAISRGIYANTANTGWSISGCKFFQTAPRTYTTGNIHTVIRIASGDNHLISGNTIGFATSAGTGTYAMDGAVATRFIGIDLNVGTTTATSVQGNTITAISLGTSSGVATTHGVLCGINITAGNVNVGTTAGNTIGSTFGVGTLSVVPTATQGAVVGIHTASTGTIAIANNTMGGFSSTSPTATIAGGVFGITVSAAATALTITNNTIGNSTTNSMLAGVLGTTTGSSIGAGISITTNPTNTCIITGNTIRNFSTFGTGTGGFVRGIATPLSTSLTATYTVSSNTISDLTTTGAVTGLTSGNAAASGIQFFAAGGSTVSNNTIFNISYAGSATTNVVVVGITLAGTAVTAGNNTVSGNTIHSLSNSGTGTSATLPPVVAGIGIRSGPNNQYNIFNNMISLGNGQITNTTFIGIWANHGSTPNPTSDNIYHNTVNIEGTAASGALSSFGFQRGTLSGTQAIPVDIRNNIFTNTRSGGTGAHYAIANHFGASANAAGWGVNASNNNVLNAAAANVGFWTSSQTFAGWQVASGSDAASFSGIPVIYVNSASDLHLNMGVVGTVIESNGQTIALVPTDFDGQTRPGPLGSVNGGATAPDLGADEIDAVPACVTATVGTLQPGDFSSCTADSLTLSVSSYSPGSVYTWESSPFGLNTWTATGGTDPNNYSTGLVTGPTDFRLVVTCPTNSSTVYSDTLTFYVGDSTKPVAICQNLTVTLDSTGIAVITGSAIDNGSTDNCTSSPSLNFTLGQDTFTCASVGTNLVILFVADSMANTDTCSALVTVNAPAFSGTVAAAVFANGQNVSCNGGNDGTATVTTSGGCPAYTYNWSNGQTTATTTGLVAGSYTVTITDAGGQSDVLTVVLTEPTALSVTATATDESCVPGNDGTIDLALSGGSPNYTYLWSNSAISQDLSGLAAGTYTVTVTDTVGCTTVASATVNASVPPATPVITQNGNNLETSSIGVTFQWFLNGTPISGATSSTTPITVSGSYTVTITDTNGCTATSAPFVAVGLSGTHLDNAMQLWPNPAHGTAFVTLPGSDVVPCTLILTDLRGRVLYQQENADLSGKVEIDLKGLAAGTYIVEALQGDQRHTLRLVVE